jgi:hypothetical protein
MTSYLRRLPQAESAYFFSNCCGQRGFPNLTNPNAPAAFAYTGCDHSRSKFGQVHHGFLEYSFSKKDKRGKEQSFAQAACKNESLVEDHVERRSLQENDIRFQQQARVAKLCRTGPDAQASSTLRPLRTSSDGAAVESPKIPKDAHAVPAPRMQKEGLCF